MCLSITQSIKRSFIFSFIHSFALTTLIHAQLLGNLFHSLPLSLPLSQSRFFLRYTTEYDYVYYGSHSFCVCPCLVLSLLILFSLFVLIKGSLHISTSHPNQRRSGTARRTKGYFLFEKQKGHAHTQRCVWSFLVQRSYMCNVTEVHMKQKQKHMESTLT